MIATDSSRAAIDECTRLMLDFARHVDHREIDRVVALFTPDATFERKAETLRGQAQIRAAQEARPVEVVTRHVCANTYVDLIDDDHAVGMVYFVLYRYDGTKGVEPALPVPLDAPQTVGEYHDEFERTPGGWRIARRKAVAAFRR